MENAGRGAADVIERELARRRRRAASASSSCAAPATTAATASSSRGTSSRAARSCSVFVAGAVAKMTADARANHDAFVGLGGTVRELAPHADLAALHASLDAADVVVDALFGTGLDRRSPARAPTSMNAMNARPMRTVALDVPSRPRRRHRRRARRRGSRRRHGDVRAPQARPPHAAAARASPAGARRRHRRARLARRGDHAAPSSSNAQTSPLTSRRARRRAQTRERPRRGLRRLAGKDRRAALVAPRRASRRRGGGDDRDVARCDRPCSSRA